MTGQPTLHPQIDPAQGQANASLKEVLMSHLQAVLTEAGPKLNDLTLTPEVLAFLKIERPRNAEHGDLAVNVSSLAKFTRMAPPQIAQALEACWALEPARADFADISVIGGFLNFKLSPDAFCNGLAELLANPEPGKNSRLAGERVLLEFVSANPTGPLHIGHGRWAALGDSIRRVLAHCGAFVTSEFYINDAGVQIENLTQSFWRRAIEKIDPVKYPFPQKIGDEPFPYYPGEYLIDLVEAYFAENPAHQTAIQAALLETGETLQEPLKQVLSEYAKTTLLNQQKALLNRVGVPFEVWYSEKSLHESGQVKETLKRLEASGYTVTQEGALWFKTTEFGDEKDRVLVKSDGSYTYLTADIAYHVDKFTRSLEDGSHYNRVINIWGADHHGYIARMKASIAAMGFEVNQFEVLLGQLVNLIVDGEKTRMGKRRSMLTLEDVVDEVGVDATRFWMVSKSADTALDFDVQLAQSKTDENPVFYAQYAHARCSSILRNATQGGVSAAQDKPVAPVMSQEAFENLLKNLTPHQLLPLLTSLDEDLKSQQTVKQILLRLNAFEELVADAARLRAPHLIARYSLDLAADFHSFYNACRVLTDTLELTQARLMLIVAVKKVFQTALHLLGVSAPEQM
jgi:arginyl-tRNA synthetase